MIEPLESRIAPATFTTFSDLDGDLVKVTASTGPLDQLDFTFIVGANGVQVARLDLTDPAFAGANITFSVTRQPGGDGLVNVGYIDATGVDLGNVTVKGDLGRIDAGNGNDADGPSLKTLSVRSLGRLGGASLESNIFGHLVALKVSGDVKDVSFFAGSIGAVSIGGSLLGGTADFAGQIRSFDDMGPVKIGRDIVGGAGGNAGLVQAFGKLTSVTVGGSVYGGSGVYTGAIRAFDLGAVKIGRDVIGGLGANSGSITAEENGSLASVTIGRSLLGGAGVQSGIIFAGDDDGAGAATLGKVTIGGHVQGGGGSSSGKIYAESTTAAVKIARDLVGGAAADAGKIESGGILGSVIVGGSLIGGSALNAGKIESGALLASVTIGGSVIGGSNTFTGSLSGLGIGPVKIGGDLRGGFGGGSGLIGAIGMLASLTVGGSVIGGSGDDSAEIRSIGDMGPIKIGGDLIGGSVTGAAFLNASGLIRTTSGAITSVWIGGSIIAGIDTSTGQLTTSASIRADYDIGSLTVKGSIIGNTAGDDSFVVISGLGQETPTATTNLAIGKITIGGRVEYAHILGGYNGVLNALNGNAQIGKVSVGGDWIASSLVAGVQDGGLAGFGDAGDTVIGAGTIARIASVIIKGVVVGTPGVDQFGIISHEIGAFKVGPTTIGRTPGTIDGAVNLAPATGDVTLREV